MSPELACKKECTMPDTANPTYVGLDISKARLEYTIDESRTACVPNDVTGHRMLVQWLKAHSNARVVCEPTGGYERAIVVAMLTAGIEVCMPPAGRARYYALAEGLRAKTDAIDAQMLRRYGQAVKLRLAEPPDPETAVLRQLVDRRRGLLERLTEVEGQLELAGDTLAQCLEREKRFLSCELHAIEKGISSHIDHHAALKQKFLRMQLLAGVGPVLASTLLAYVPELGSIPDERASAILGVAPFARDSGSIQHERHIRGGRAEARQVLYMAAMSAIRNNDILKAFYERLRANGKPSKVCIVAVMRKMATVINRLLADPNFKLAN